VPEAAIEAGGRGGSLAGRGRGAGRGPSTVPGQPPATPGAPGAPAATPTAPAGRGGGLTTGLEGLPFVKPPYGVLTAIDLNKGEIKFKVPHGDTPDNVRAALERLGINYPEKNGRRAA
jgi:Glucose dehydrogenase